MRFTFATGPANHDTNFSHGLQGFCFICSRIIQASKATITRLAVPSLPVLDFRPLSHYQLPTAQAVFDDFREVDLQPAFIADVDDNRALLDPAIICHVLGLDADV